MAFPNRWCPKMLQEYLCSQYVYAPDEVTRRAINDLVGILCLHRPTGSNGKHGDLHTPTCGCDDLAEYPMPSDIDRIRERRDGD